MIPDASSLCIYVKDSTDYPDKACIGQSMECLLNPRIEQKARARDNPVLG